MPATPSAGTVRWIFRNARGLRAGWRFALFNAFTLLVSLPFALWLRTRFHLGEGAAFTVELLVLVDAIYLLAALVATAAMARIERRTFAEYGVPFRRILGRRFWEGTAWGAATLAVIALLVALGGGLTIAGARSGAEVGRAGLWWLLGTLLIAVFEEVSFRGYQLFTLAEGMGFWPAALLESLYFGWVLHYLEKPDETLLDGLNVSLVALAFCFMVRRTGDVWFATGWHWTFNFASFFVLGSPNTAFGGAVEPHWLAAAWSGPRWLTGGATGLEASALATPVFAALFPLLAWRLPRREPSAAR